MSRRNKLQKFSENLAFPNVYENFNIMDGRLFGEGGREVDMKGHWAEKAFGNDRPITLELACGRGEYSLGLARKYPDRNFIGVDIKGARIWKGAKTALEEDLKNVCFLRIRIEQLERFFDAEEISEIWITFPDPFLKKSKVNRRLTSPRFLKAYSQILQKGGRLHLKTDEPVLYEYTLEVLQEDPKCEILQACADIYSAPLPLAELEIKTWYERMHLREGKKIKYTQWKFEEEC